MQARIRKERKFRDALWIMSDVWGKIEYSVFNEWQFVKDIDRISNMYNVDLEMFIIKIEDFIVENLRTKYETRLKEKRTTLEEIDRDIKRKAILYNAELRLLSFINIWEIQYPDAVEKNELKKIVNDNQNVHTRIINSQTEKSMKIIKDVEISPGQRTLDEIITAWLNSGKSWNEIQPIYKDMENFGNQPTIYSEGDYLYRKTLRSLWALIKTYKDDVYNQLVNRLYEECLDSVEMCAQGHISRLANVMVGFHDGFLSPRNIKEEFQENMANIANNNKLNDKEKIEQAIVLMNAIDMPEDERQAWLTAF